MKKHASKGPSIYYASDKNVFDALNEHKVDLPTILKLFERRGILVSRKSGKEQLAKYFSQLTHDYYDHRDIGDRLGVAQRRERITSMRVAGMAGEEAILASIEIVKENLGDMGDVVNITRLDDNFRINVKYTTIDYGRTEFAQVQSLDGVIEFVKSDDSYIVRNSHNDYISTIRDEIINGVELESGKKLIREEISLFDIPDPRLRTKFFIDLSEALPGFQRSDVTDVYVYKPKPPGTVDDDADPEAHVDRISLRGEGISRSELLHELSDDDYYIVKMGWLTKEVLGSGHLYDVEVSFSDIKDCGGFSFILSGVFPTEDGKLSLRRRSPLSSEIESMSRLIETASRDIVTTLRQANYSDNGS